MAAKQRSGYDRVMSTETVTKTLFTVEQFFRICEAGILPPDRRYELIRGEIMEMPGPNPPHAGRVKRLNRLLTSTFGELAIVSVQDPVILDRYSVPFPDLALLRPTPDFYTNAHPVPEDILLLIEVADTTVRRDSTIKADLYAEVGIGEYWLLDIPADSLIVYTNPANGAYQNIVTLHRGETVSPQQLPATFSVDEILG